MITGSSLSGSSLPRNPGLGQKEGGISYASSWPNKEDTSMIRSARDDPEVTRSRDKGQGKRRREGTPPQHRRDSKELFRQAVTRNSSASVHFSAVPSLFLSL